MNIRTLSRRVAATGGVAALAAGAFVGATSTAAIAAPTTSVYTCELPGLAGPWDVTLDSDIPGIDALAGTGVPAGIAVDADFPLFSEGVTNRFTIPAEAHAALGGYGVEDISFAKFQGSFGASKVGVTGMAAKVSEMTHNEDGTYSFDADGVNAAFEAPKAGTHDVLTPAGFDLVATTSGFGNVAVPCVLKSGTTPGSYVEITVFKNDSTTTGKPAAKTLKTTKVAKMKVTVAAHNEVPGGKVLIKEGRQKLGSGELNAQGVAVVSMGELKKGAHDVKVIYKGDDYTNASNEAVTFTIAKG